MTEDRIERSTCIENTTYMLSVGESMAIHALCVIVCNELWATMEEVEDREDGSRGFVKADRGPMMSLVRDFVVNGALTAEQGKDLRQRIQPYVEQYLIRTHGIEPLEDEPTEEN